MSHDQGQPGPTGASSAAAAEFGVFSHGASTPSSTLGSSSGQDKGSTGSPASAVVAMARTDSVGLTPLQRWTTRASESQFNALSGAVGGFTSGVVTCPLDVIKTKLQAQGGFVPISKGRHVGHHKVYEGLLGTARVIWKEEGIRGMYRGLGPIIMGYLPTWAVWFTVYTKSKEYFAEKEVQNQFMINFYSSIVAGASSTIVTNPIWVIKTRLMSQSSRDHHRHDAFPRSGNTPTSRPSLSSPWHYNSTLDAARKMYSSEGMLSFYSGLTPALLGLSHVAVQFPVYEYLRTEFTGQEMGHMGDGNAQRHWLGVLSASIMSKIMASSATYPHEVIRTRLQTQRRPTAGSEYLQGMGVGSSGENGAKAAVPSAKYKGVVMTFRTILKEEGWRAFYAGMGVNMARAVPAATVTMMTYEYVMNALHEQKATAIRLRDQTNSAPPEP